MKLVAISVCILLSFYVAVAQIATTTVNTASTINSNTPLLFGITFDARSSMTANAPFFQIGYHNPDASVIPAVDALFGDFPMSTLRYPANAVSYGFDWKKSVGPFASRPNQNLLVNLGVPQPMYFGFDEFMAMTAARGVSPADIQIMIPIYDSTTVGLTPTQAAGAIGNPAAFNADWVEYCNAPNDGSNPGGGTDWAAQRAANGHPAPYGVKIWNIGNEPWASGEFGNTATAANNYLAYVTPTIDAMLAIDPTLHITLPTTGNPTNSASWAYSILNSALVTQHKIFGISQHFFLNENVVGGIIPAGVASARNNLTPIINVTTLRGVKILIGDYAHSIACCSVANDDLAMQWQGANLEADFLLMISQVDNIDRTNYWAYATTVGTLIWKPIRKNSNGTYTLMPAAGIYKKLFPAFLNKSLAVTNTSPPASDGNVYAVRSGAFATNDLSKVNVISVNRDKLNTFSLQVNGLAGYSLTSAKLLSAAALTSETFTETPITPDGLGNFTIPAMGVVILEYTLTALPLSLLDYDVNIVNNNSVLNAWQTGTTINPGHFNIQRSVNGTNFITVGKVDNTGAGNYQFIDHPIAGTTQIFYYRLEIVDSYNSKTYSGIKTVTIKPAISAILLYPNPATVRINFPQQLTGIRVYNMQGQLVMPVIQQAKGIDVTALPNGLYNLKANEGIFSFEIKR